MKILVIGTGYVGLVTGSCFAEMGHHVTCLDVDTKKLALLKKGTIPIYEPGLEEIVKRNIKSGRLLFSNNYQESVDDAQFCFLALPTPCKAGGECDLTYIEQAIVEIALHMKEHKVIVNKSTVPVGTNEAVRQLLSDMLANHGKDISFDVVSNPEFLKEGDAVNDFMKPDRIVLGVESPSVEKLMRELYAPFNINHERILVMDPISAEMTKYAANAMLATRISFMNELAGLCEKTGANINLIRKGLGSDSRIGYSFLYAGVGYGGSCFPKDIKALMSKAETLDHPLSILQAVESVNTRQKKLLAEKIKNYFQNDLSGKTLAIWGLSFKPGTDDMREATSLVLIQEMLELGVTLRLFDPVAMNNAKKLLPHPDLIWCQDENEAAIGADAIVLVTEWKQFRFAEFEEIKKVLKGYVIFDGRNQYNPKEMFSKGFDYIGIGQPSLLNDQTGQSEEDFLEEEAFYP
ncbi:MAG: UDP-glucose/GDP-mannose dehydrogenase family protein [Parachlamydiales bacterium]|nr:UDP-glucose/GDP-mannose dehydrogenase family protein [Parachlamydiales bacterium]